MTTYAVTVNHPAGYVTTVRNVTHATMLDGLTSFGGIKLFGNERQPILSFKAERHTPSNNEITCDGKFSCE